MFTILVVLIIILSIFLTLVVLSQAAKGNGLAGGLGAPGSVGTMFGVRRASDFLMKATIIIAGTFMLLTIVVNRFYLAPPGLWFEWSRTYPQLALWATNISLATPTG